jgi:hypothetical protein
MRRVMNGMAEKKALQCWKCGADVSGARLPDAREARCPVCEVDLHVCRLCRHYEPRLSGQCDEERAEEVMNKERANFCDWFTPRPGAFVSARDSASKAARERLEKMFDGADSGAAGKTKDAAATRSALEDLFKKPSK